MTRVQINLVVILGGLFMILGAVNGFAAPLSWTSKAQTLTPRSRGVSAAVSGEIYVLGGIGNSGPTSLVEVYDPLADSWQARSSLSETVYAAAGSVQGDTVYLAGGSAGAALSDTKILGYNTSSGLTSQVGTLNEGRMRSSAAILGNKMYIVGGSRQGTVLATIEEFDLTTHATIIKANLPAALELTSMAVIDGKIYIVGGVDQNGLPANNCWLYDPQIDGFTARSPAPIPVGAWRSVVANGKLYLVGGFTSYVTPFSWTDAIQEYDPLTNYWRTVGAIPTARYGHAAEVVNNLLYVIGGDASAPGSPPNNLTVNEAAGLFSDPLPPTTAITLTGTAGVDGWYVSTVGVTLSAADNPGGSGIAQTEYSFDGSSWNSYTGEFQLTTEGMTTISYRSRDNAGNIEVAQQQQIYIDKTAPDTSITYKPADPSSSVSGAFLFTSNDVGATFECSLDAGGFSSCGTTYIFSSLAAGSHSFSVRAIDQAGNIDASPVVYSWNITAGAQSAWLTAAPLPIPVSRAASAVVDGKTYVLGGGFSTVESYTDGGDPEFGGGMQHYLPVGHITDSVQLFDPLTNSWQTKPPLCYPVSSAAAASQGGIIYLAGGMNVSPFTGFPYNPAVEIKSSIIAYNTADRSCRQLGWLQTPRKLAGGAILNNKMYVVGGNGYGATLDSVEEIDLVSGSSSIKTQLPEPRENAGLVALGSKLYIMGGWNSNGTFGNCWQYDPALNTFVAKTPMPIPVASMGITVLNGKIYLVGGQNQGGVSAVVQEYDPILDSWKIVTMVPTPRYAAVATMTGGSLSVIGGESNPMSAMGTNEAWNSGVVPVFQEEWRVHSVYSLVPGVIDWATAQHQPVAAGNYLHINGTFYYVIDSYLGSWLSSTGGAYSMARLQSCDQLTGVPLFDPMNQAHPLLPDLSGATGGHIDLYTVWPYPQNATWVINSTNADNPWVMDWRADQHLEVEFGSYLKIAGLFYYVYFSGVGSWSGLEYNVAALFQCDQLSGAVLFDPSNPAAPLRANLTAMNGKGIALYSTPVQGGSFIITTSTVGNGTLSCTSPVLKGGNSTCTIEPNPGTVLHTLTDNNFNVSGNVSGNTYVIRNVLSSHQVVAEFSPESFEVIWNVAANKMTNKAVVDSQGNVYLLGESSAILDGAPNAGITDAFVQKFSASGIKLWTRQIGSSEYDYGMGIAVDTNGNLFVVGDTAGSIDGNGNLGGEDIFILKLDSNGNRLWSRQIGSNYNDYASDVALDNSGNIYLIGWTQGLMAGTSYYGNGNMVAAKYDTNGNQLWLKQVPGYSRSDSIALDPGGNVYLGGSAGTDFLLLKWDAVGNQLWSKQFGLKDANSSAKALTADSKGGVYAIYQNSIPTLPGYYRLQSTLIKYDHAGNTLWTRQTEYPVLAMKTGRDDNIYLSGFIGTDLFLHMYDRNGNRIQALTFATGSSDGMTLHGALAVAEKVYLLGNGSFMKLGSRDAANMTGLSSAITIPVNGGFVKETMVPVFGTAENLSGNVTGVEISTDNGVNWNQVTDTSANNSFATWRFDWFPVSEGTFLLKTRASSSGIIEPAGAAVTVSVDRTPPQVLAGPPGGIYHAAMAVALQTYETAVIRYTLDGSDPTSASLVYGSPLQINSTTTVKYRVVDAIGNLSAIMSEEYIIAPFAPWTRQIGAQGDDRTAMTLDSSGNIFMIGSTDGNLAGPPDNNYGYNLFIAKYGAGGEKLLLQQTATTGAFYPVGNIGFDDSGLLHTMVMANCDMVTLVCPIPQTYVYNFYLLKFDNAGNRVFARQLELPASTNQDSIRNYTVDASGNSYLIGSQWGAEPGYFVTKYDVAGNKLWSKRGGTAYADYPFDLTLDPGGNIYLTGETGGSLNGNQNKGGKDIYVVKMDPAGTVLWTRQQGTAADERGTGITVDSQGNVYVSGTTKGTLEGESYSGFNDAFISKYDANGNRLWTRLVASSVEIYWQGKPLVDGSGNVYLSGSTTAGLDGNMNSGGYDIFTVKFAPDGTRIWTKQLGSAKDDLVRASALFGDGSLYLAGTTEGGLNGNSYAGIYGTDVFLLSMNNPAASATDVTPPDTAILGKPANISNNATDSFTFMATEPDSTFECRLDGGSYAPCTTPFNFSGLTAGSHNFSVRAKDPAGNIDPTPAVCIWTITPKFILSVTRAGEGGGTVVADPGGVLLSTGISGSLQVNGGTIVHLIATADVNSVFSGWNGLCSGTGDCLAPVSADSTVFASFSPRPQGAMGPVRVITSTASYFTSHQAALNSLAGGAATIIESSARSAIETINLISNIDVTLKGGYDSSYSVTNGHTLFQGSITVSNGSLSLENIVIQ